MSRMESPQTATARVTARVDEETKEEFKSACEEQDTTMSDVLKERVDEMVSTYQPDAGTRSTGYYPDDPVLRDLYEACLDVAADGSHGPTIYQRRHASSIARQTRQVAKNELADALLPLRRRGYVAQGVMPPSLQGEAAERWRNWIIKPPEADPEQWIFREGKR